MKGLLPRIIAEDLQGIIDQDLESPNSLFIKIRDEFIDQLAQKIVNYPQKSIMVGVCGESASGKTTIAHRILNACVKENIPQKYTILAMDDYYHDTSRELESAGSYEALFASGFSFDSPEAFNLELLKEHMIFLAGKKQVYSPEYDFVTCRSISGKKPKQPARVILVEGLFALHPVLKEFLDVAVYVETPHNIIKDRWYKRAASRGKTGKAADMQFFNVNSEAKKHIRPAGESADIVVSGMISADYIEFMAEQFISTVRESIALY